MRNYEAREWLASGTVARLHERADRRRERRRLRRDERRAALVADLQRDADEPYADTLQRVASRAGVQVR